MAAGDILITHGSTVTWAASGGTYTLTLTSLANSAGRKGVVVHDLGTPRAGRYRVYLPHISR